MATKRKPNAKKREEDKVPVTVDAKPVKTKEVEVTNLIVTLKPTKLNVLLGRLVGMKWVKEKRIVEDK